METTEGWVLDALDEMTDEYRTAYHRVRQGLDKLEADLPERCTPETQEAIGTTIKTAIAVEKFATTTFKTLAEPHARIVDRLRALWKPQAERAAALAVRARGLVEHLLAEQTRKRAEQEAEARRVVAKAQAEQAAAEARALAAESQAEQERANKQAEVAWNQTRQAVSQLDSGPATTKVKVGPATVYGHGSVDYEITDIGAFATAHPELVEIKRGPTLAGLRDAVHGLVEVPEAVPGWPGLKVYIARKTAAR